MGNPGNLWTDFATNGQVCSGVMFGGVSGGWRPYFFLFQVIKWHSLVTQVAKRYIARYE